MTYAMDLIFDMIYGIALESQCGLFTSKDIESYKSGSEYQSLYVRMMFVYRFEIVKP